VAALSRAADRYKAVVSKATLDEATTRRVNTRLLQAERQFIDEGGLPRRSWYRHLLYAPGFYTGYGVKTMPGVREGIEHQRGIEPQQQRVAVGRSLRDQPGTNVAARAWSVVDDDRLPQALAQAIGDRPRAAVGSPARTERHHQPHRLGRIVLGPQNRRGGKQPDRAAQQRQRPRGAAAGCWRSSRPRSKD
jgi:hypothetical protein